METFWQDWVLRYDLDRQLILADRLQNSSRRLGMHWLDGWSETASQWKPMTRAWFAPIDPTPTSARRRRAVTH